VLAEGAPDRNQDAAVRRSKGGTSGRAHLIDEITISEEFFRGDRDRGGRGGDRHSPSISPMGGEGGHHKLTSEYE
jgi:hypothetical protein